MNCPKCKARISFTQIRCNNCGQELKDYRRIISCSNACYNRGLSQAKVRDLSGAIISLKQSLQYNKYNTNARNLLGLIYYEMGEVVAALSEWVISKNFQEKQNEADRFIREVQSNPNQLELHSQMVKKYNSALFSAQHGDEDMAIIQLKKVVNVNPRFVRANQLLALLYMMSGKREDRIKAHRLLKTVSKVDINNTTTLSYLKELSDVKDKSVNTVPKQERKDINDRKNLPRVDVDSYQAITPYKEEKPSVLPVVNVLVGVVIGLALMYCLILPHIKSNNTTKDNDNFKKYSEDQAAADGNASTLQNENKKLQKKIDELENELASQQGIDAASGVSILDTYDTILEAVRLYMDKNNEKAAEKLINIEESALTSDAAKKLYAKVKKETFEGVSEKYFKEGRDAYNGDGSYAGNRDYEKAVSLLDNALEYNPDNTDALYFLGRCYQQQSDMEKAKEYYKKIVDEYPDSSRVSEANQRLRELGE